MRSDPQKTGTPPCEAIERRSWRRLPLAIPVFVRGTAEDGQPFMEFATALNISAGGILLAARRAGMVRAQLTVEIASAPSASAHVAAGAVKVLKGRVARMSEGEHGRVVALRFAQPLGAKSGVARGALLL